MILFSFFCYLFSPNIVVLLYQLSYRLKYVSLNYYSILQMITYSFTCKNVIILYFILTLIHQICLFYYYFPLLFCIYSLCFFLNLLTVFSTFILIRVFLYFLVLFWSSFLLLFKLHFLFLFNNKCIFNCQFSVYYRLGPIPWVLICSILNCYSFINTEKLQFKLPCLIHELFMKYWQSY